MEVEIPDAEPTPKARAEQHPQQQALQQSQNASVPATAPAPTTESGGRYVLLAGSYADPKAADEAKAKLAMLGVVAKVQSITINGKVWNRVMVGPYANASDTENAKRSLTDNGIKAIPMKEAGSP
jgi:cell division protein FtsN